MVRKRLGELLLEAGLITGEQLDKALAEQKRTGERLGKVLIRQGLVKEQDIINVLEFQLGIPQVRLAPGTLDRELARILPEPLARRYQAVPVRWEGGRLVVAMVDPLNVTAVDDLRLRTGREILPAIAPEADIERALAELYGQPLSLEELATVEEGEGARALQAEVFDLDRPAAAAGAEAPVVRLVNGLLQQALRERASDVHLEPQAEAIRVRYRVDGTLRPVMTLPKTHHAPLVSRIKVMAGMDIAEKRLPQDGRVQIRVAGRQVDLRVSTLPTIFGEKVVIRLLDRTSAYLALDELGFGPKALSRYRELVRRSYGMILVTGPTGSGKTTTLYATLREINTPEKNIITIEDPVEYVLEGINQIRVNPKAGLTFASGLRSILRQDPDVIMVGEIRDRETADIAIRSANTGHLVLSTMHTNDAAGAVTRLLDMGIEPFLVASSVIGVVAQRLVRTLCRHCRRPYEVPAEAEERLLLGEPPHTPLTLYRAVGCPECGGTGYRGRTAILEVMPMTGALRRLVLARASSEEIAAQAVAEGMVTLWRDGLEKARQGLTTLEEVVRVAYAGE
ncbi:MAG: type II secretion system ATPase GspE [Moorellales bacterium]